MTYTQNLPGYVVGGTLNANALTVLETIMNAKGPPSLREIMRAAGISIHAAHVQVIKLKKMGLVKDDCTDASRKARTTVATCRFIPVDKLALADPRSQ